MDGADAGVRSVAAAPAFGRSGRRVCVLGATFVAAGACSCDLATSADGTSSSPPVVLGDALRATRGKLAGVSGGFGLAVATTRDDDDVDDDRDVVDDDVDVEEDEDDASKDGT